jgi:hypothetical protein
MLDVGSGDALKIQTPTGRYVLVDGGPSTRALSDPLGRRLDWLVVAGTSSEQVAALPGILPRFTPDQVLGAGRSGAVLLLEWRNFRTLLPIGLDNNLS